MLSDLLVNESIIHRLTEGDAESVRRLRSIGFTFHWMVERLLNAEGEPLVVNEEGALPEGARVERHSVWHWSHRAPCADAVAEWWHGLHAVLEQATTPPPARVMAHHLEDALSASALSGETVPMVYTWRHAMALRMPSWERKLMLDRLFNSLERHGDRLVPLLDALAQESLLTARDWEPARRASYVRDPLTALYQAGAWDSLKALHAQGAALVLWPSQRSVLDDLVDRLRSGESVPGAAPFLLHLVDQQAEVSLHQVEALARVLPDIEDVDTRNHLMALQRRHRAPGLAAKEPSAAARPRRRS